MQRDEETQQLILQFQQHGAVDCDVLHRICKFIDIKVSLPFSEQKTEGFMTVLWAAYERAESVKQAKYLNTMLHIKDVGALPADMNEKIEHALTKVCAC